jgi:hypothetical protein
MFARWSTVSVGVGGVLGGLVGGGVTGGVGVAGGVEGGVDGGVGAGLVGPPPGLGLLGVDGSGVVGLGLGVAGSSLWCEGSVPVPLGTSCVPLR